MGPGTVSKPSIRGVAALLLLAVTGTTLSAESSPLSAAARKILSRIDAGRALETVDLVYASDRYFTFPSFERTTGILQKRLAASGLTEIELGAAPADGHSQAGFWTMPLAWDVDTATLDIVSPAKQRLCDYRAVPTCLGMWSGATPAGGIDAQLVDLDSAKPDDLRGKLVLTTQNSAELKAKLVKFGALGAVNGFSENPELRNDRQWINAWGDYGWAYTKTSTPLLSFSVTPAQAGHLRTLLAKGPVRLRANVKTRYYEGKYPWISAILRGANPQEEVLVLAHTSEQGAQDNATGVSASIEALHTIQKLIAAGELAIPRRSIRILLMPEMYGSLDYITTHSDRMKRTVASMTVDTPAASYDLAGTEYTIYHAPDVGRSWADALMPHVARTVLPARRPWHEADHTTGTDAYLSEPTINVPNVWIYSGTGVTTHHNSADTPKTVDKRSMSDLIALTAVYLYAAATAGEDEARWLTEMSADDARQQLIATASRAVTAQMSGDPATAALLRSRLDYIANRNEVSLQTLTKIGAKAETLDRSIRDVRRLAAEQSDRLAAIGIDQYRPARPAHDFKVRRKRIGSIPLDDLPVDQREGFPSGAWNRVVTFALYWCDGKRTVSEAAYLTEMEIGRPLKFDFAAYFRFLERHGYVDIAD